MTKLNISQAAKAYSKDRKTIARHIDEGKLSCEINRSSHKLIDLSELIREYGEPKRIPSPVLVSNDEAKHQSNAPLAARHYEQQISDLKEQTKLLREEKDRDRREYQQRENRLLQMGVLGLKGRKPTLRLSLLCATCVGLKPLVAPTFGKLGQGQKTNFTWDLPIIRS